MRTLKKAVADALLLRGSRDFTDLPADRRILDEIVGRPNAHSRKRIEVERAELKALPERRRTDYEEAIVHVTSAGGFPLRHVFYRCLPALSGIACAPGFTMTGWSASSAARRF